MSRAERIEKALREAFSPKQLQVVDESHRHAGHAGASPEGETHFQVLIVSDGFAGVGRVQRQRLVNEVLQAEFASGLHALSISAKTPEEVA